MFCTVPRAIIFSVPPYCPVPLGVGTPPEGEGADAGGAAADVGGAAAVVDGLGAAADVGGAAADDGGAAAVVAAVVLGGTAEDVGEEQAGNNKAIEMITMKPSNTQFFLTFSLLFLTDFKPDRQSKSILFKIAYYCI